MQICGGSDETHHSSDNRIEYWGQYPCATTTTTNTAHGIIRCRCIAVVALPTYYNTRTPWDLLL